MSPSITLSFSDYRDRLAKIDKKSVDADSKEARRNLLKERRLQVSVFASDQIIRSIQTDTDGALTRFWFNHFNVYSEKGVVGAALPDYLHTAIKPHVRGHFRDLLRSVLLHPAMLVYLDNDRNRKDRINENLARELLELHTLGVDGGYSQQDVHEVARLLTGFGLRPLQPVRMPPRFENLALQQGEFFFDPRQHDFSPKRILGQTIEGKGFSEIDQLVVQLSRQPSTARHISHRLAVFLLGEAIPASLIDQAAQVFLRSDGDLQQLTTFILQQRNSFRHLRTFKDPYRWVVSSIVLLTNGQRLDQPSLALRWLTALGQPLFGHRTPDGYSLKGSDWLNAGQLTQRFELAQEIINTLPRLHANAPRPAEIWQSTAIKTLLAAAGPATAQAVAKAEDPSLALSLLLASPEWMYWSPWQTPI